MSKHGPCELGLPTCISGPLAWWQRPEGRLVRLCKPHLDLCFDAADDAPASEPTAWGWLIAPEPAAADVAAWLRDPHNREAVALVLRREARIGAPWLREFIDREDRIRRSPSLVGMW